MKLLTIGLLFSIYSICSAETISVGSWRDAAGTAFDRKLEIVATDGDLVEVSEFTGGSKTERPLTEIKKRRGEQRRFLVKERPFGEGIAIRNDGDLNLFDEDGLIRVAKRIDGK